MESRLKRDSTMMGITSESHAQYYACIEAGGTKFNCEVIDGLGNTIAQAVFPTLSPEQTLPDVVSFFKPFVGCLHSLGIACFGPVQLDKEAQDYGYIRNTPKPGWSNTSVANYFAYELAIPVVFDTDVNGALLGEWTQGAAQGCSDFVYVTVGTGIGAGILANNQVVRGVCHLEVGHMLVPRFPDDNFNGCCPYHGACLEGMASGVALERRWGRPHLLPADHPAWDMEAYYLAVMCVNLTHQLAPQKIVLAGGVMQQTSLLAKIRSEFSRLINGYASEKILANLEQYICGTSLKGRAGAIGCWVMAKSIVDKPLQ